MNPSVTNLGRYDWTAERLSELLREAPSRIVADIGSSNGRMRTAVETAGGEWRGFDIDPQDNAVERWDLNQPSPKLEAGTVLMLDVIEHLPNPWLALQHISNAMLPGAYIVITTPNPRWSRSRMHALAFGNLTCFTESDLKNNHHVFTPWPHILFRLLTDSGLTPVSMTMIEGRATWPGKPFTHRYLVRLGLAVMMKLIERRDITACGMSYGVIAKKDQTPILVAK